MEGLAETEPYLYHTLLAMLEWYDARWGDEQDEYAVAHVEAEWRTRMVAPDGKPTRFHIAGKVDKQVLRQSWLGQCVFDHKTSAYDLGFSSPYWQGLQTDCQALHYQLLLSVCCEDPISDVVWDVIQKPTIRPQAHKETPEQYGDRVREWYAGRGFERTIARRSVGRTQGEVVEYAEELYQETRDLLHARRTKYWRKNPNACMAYGRPCAYLGICSGFDSPDSDHWLRGQQHQELSKKMKGDLLTHSRMTCFRQCPRKHYFKYELGLKKDREEEAEALYFGTLWHEAMDAYWTCKED